MRIDSRNGQLQRRGGGVSLLLFSLPFGVVVWSGRLLPNRRAAVFLFDFCAQVVYNRGTKYRRAMAMTRAKRATRLAVREVERLCGGKYARIVRELVREGNHATFAGVEQRAIFSERIEARVVLSNGEVWGFPCKQVV